MAAGRIEPGGVTPGWGTRGPRGPTEGTPTWRPHTSAELTERIRYKNPNAAAVRVMPGIPDPRSMRVWWCDRRGRLPGEVPWYPRGL